MKRIALLFILVIFSASIPQLWAEKIKYGKYVIYEGPIIKQEGKKIPSGEGVLYIKNIDKNEPDVVTVAGTFEGGVVTSAIIRLGLAAIFEGRIGFDVENSKAGDNISLLFYEGLVRIPSEEQPFEVAPNSQSRANVCYDYKQKVVLPSWPDWESVYQKDAKYETRVFSGQTTKQGNLKIKEGKYTFIGIPISGTITDKKGNTFSGDIASGNSKGKIAFSNGDWAEGTFDSDLENGLVNWKLITGNCDMDIYAGHFIGSMEKKKLSKGTFTLKDGGCYEGTWKDGVFYNGTSSGNITTGNYNATKEYKGYFNGTWEDGIFVKGDCSCDKMPNHDFKHFKGNVDKDILSGLFDYGKYKFQGRLKNDIPDGYCQYTRNQADSIIGTWQDGRCLEGVFKINVNNTPLSGTIKNSDKGPVFSFYNNGNLFLEAEYYCNPKEYFLVFEKDVKNKFRELENADNIKQNADNIKLEREELEKKELMITNLISSQPRLISSLSSSDYKKPFGSRILVEIEDYSYLFLNSNKNGGLWIELIIASDSYQQVKKFLLKTDKGEVIEFNVKYSFRTQNEAKAYLQGVGNAIGGNMAILLGVGTSIVPDYWNRFCTIPTLIQWKKLLSSKITKVRLVYESSMADIDAKKIGEQDILGSFNSFIEKINDRRFQMDNPAYGF